MGVYEQVNNWQTADIKDAMNRPYHFHGNPGQHHFNHENRCYIDHRGERTVSEFKIRTETVIEPKAGVFYRDADDDLFIWIGGDGYPWLEITSTGVSTRSTTYPAEPLLELIPEEYEAAINSVRVR